MLTNLAAGAVSHLNYQAGYTKGYTNGFKVLLCLSPCPRACPSPALPPSVAFDGPSLLALPLRARLTGARA